ncbi:mannose-1-phosphate guanylyltransferase/mannose-6-phosphate isomerase [Acinetobacter indicus]|uniref:mannose-1-phosphate guanylyltransferase/mannose-6-phosphate isomerase n=1 Tax=Acinetobacter indicus TaxID=756892 RepID=UPI00257520BF|nr:mannose-1-phosphate guanylyltransferase/mannose-6-phosphate isomerase [Acinetobacter indicus]MDM1339250.1 mannose-1-phosphate guanylyltransferase/mannose-6-phosphate isomerase [Acinetobacter indicus]
MKTVPIVMAGGSGTRLWPLSRDNFPKQFIKYNSELSFFQETINRVNIDGLEKPIVVTNENHRFIVAQQLCEISCDATIILEPVGKNTAATIAISALHSLSEFPDENVNLLVLSADHYFEDFAPVIKKVNQLSNIEDILCVFGIVPNRAETGFGYIKKGKGNYSIYSVDEFKEKPNESTAKNFVDSGCYLWNTGVFLFNRDTLISKMLKHCSDIYQICLVAYEKAEYDLDFIRLSRDDFGKCREESIDYALLEKITDLKVCELNLSWNDVGSWLAFWEINKKDSNNNYVSGDVFCEKTENSLIYSTDKFVATYGLSNVIIINTSDALLVINKNDAQSVKKIVSYLKSNSRKECISHVEVKRPWGKFESIQLGENYQVKKITVDPGQKLSTQMHFHRAEHWVVVKGTANVLKGKNKSLITENQSIYIELGEIHSLENPGKIPLEIIEIQSGSYLGEDDIIRFEDHYGRI